MASAVASVAAMMAELDAFRMRKAEKNRYMQVYMQVRYRKEKMEDEADRLANGREPRKVGRPRKYPKKPDGVPLVALACV